MNAFPAALAATVLALLGTPASADAVFDFYKLGRGAGDFLSSDGIACTGADRCSSNVDAGVRDGDLTFSAGGITARATGTHNGQVAATVQGSDAAGPRASAPDSASTTRAARPTTTTSRPANSSPSRSTASSA